MEHPEYIYYLLVWVVALPAAVVCKPAITIPLAWTLGQFTWLLFGESWLPFGHLAGHALGATLGFFIAYRFPCTPGITLTIIFGPLILLDLWEILGLTTPLDAWWMIYWIALLQVLFVVPSTLFVYESLYHGGIKALVDDWKNGTGVWFVGGADAR